MKYKKLRKFLQTILVFLTCIFILIIKILVIDNKDKEIKKNNEPTLDPIIEQEEILNEDINIFIPSLKDTCDIDECMTNNTFTSIKNYFLENNYEETIKNNAIYYKNPSILIKLTLNEENIELNQNEENNPKYDFILNRYSTKDDINKILNNKKIEIYTGEKASKIAVLNYHFFYDKETEKCNQSICLDIKDFEQQLKYLKDNNFKTLTIEEYRSWLYKEIDLPKKSVLITIDDGAMGTSSINGNKLIPLLEKYEINATLFLITGWWKKENYQSFYLDIQSHTHLMHDEKICNNKTRGAEMLCSSKEDIINDLKKSISKVDSNTSFCFPFYLYDNKSIEALKELDFKMAFIDGNRKTTQKDDKYKLPRYIIYKTTSLNSFKNMVN